MVTHIEGKRRVCFDLKCFCLIDHQIIPFEVLFSQRETEVYVLRFRSHLFRIVSHHEQMGEQSVERRADMAEVSSITYLLHPDEQAKPRIKYVHTIWKTGFAFLLIGVAFLSSCYLISMQPTLPQLSASTDEIEDEPVGGKLGRRSH